EPGARDQPDALRDGPARRPPARVRARPRDAPGPARRHPHDRGRDSSARGVRHARVRRRDGRVRDPALLRHREPRRAADGAGRPDLPDLGAGARPRLVPAAGRLARPRHDRHRPRAPRGRVRVPPDVPPRVAPPGLSPRYIRGHLPTPPLGFCLWPRAPSRTPPRSPPTATGPYATPPSTPATARSRSSS